VEADAVAIVVVRIAVVATHNAAITESNDSMVNQFGPINLFNKEKT
jgi:hypothetical protein